MPRQRTLSQIFLISAQLTDWTTDILLQAWICLSCLHYFAGTINGELSHFPIWVLFKAPWIKSPFLWMRFNNKHELPWNPLVLLNTIWPQKLSVWWNSGMAPERQLRCQLRMTFWVAEDVVYVKSTAIVWCYILYSKNIQTINQTAIISSFIPKLLGTFYKCSCNIYVFVLQFMTSRDEHFYQGKQ